MKKRILDFLFPSVCFLCKEEIADGRGFFCADCFASLRFIIDPYCQYCGEPFACEHLGGKEKCCLSCEENPPPWQQARAVFVYDDASRKLILPLKYADRLENISPLAQLMSKFGKDLFADHPVLVPVPLHVFKLWSRRYNQSALLAQKLGKLLQLDVVPDALIRCRSTRPLAHLSVKQRHEELKGAFQINKTQFKKIGKRPVVLIDDILTTGATAEACVTILKEAGCEKISLLVVARACEQTL
ncbi:ComF family protein [Aristophania vespae]|uniref:ComF family protein n=1 Tax=Aristophania vespae TaxID=2697033 RepID=UPI0023512F48|nr:ComF family protein [Aristophania vespae]UMM63363.1 hypothetical protein DM15PD_03220 [Aristophania vespae]